jgi:hypothetical protein
MFHHRVHNSLQFYHISLRQHFVISCYFLRRGVYSPPPNPIAGGPPLVGFPRPRIQYFRSYPPYLEAVSCTRNPRSRHAVLPGTHMCFEWNCELHSRSRVFFKVFYCGCAICVLVLHKCVSFQSTSFHHVHKFLIITLCYVSLFSPLPFCVIGFIIRTPMQQFVILLVHNVFLYYHCLYI